MGSLFICVTSDNIPYEKVGDEVRSLEDEVPFEIPESWEWVRWGDLAESIQYGYNAPALQSGSIKMVRISDIQDNTVIWDSVPYCEIKEEEIETYSLKKNDILFARTGGTVGKSYLVTDVPAPAVYAGYLIRTRYSSLLCPEYLKYFMECPFYWQQLKKGTTVTAQPNCNGKTLAQMLLPLPPYNEQKRICAKLSELAPLLTEYENVETRNIQLNLNFPEALKRSILQMAVQGKLVPQNASDEPASVLLERIRTEKQRLIKEGKIKKDKTESVIFRRDNSHYEKLGENERCIDDEIPFEIPDLWQWCRLSSVINLVSGQDFEPSGYNSVENGIPYITGASNFDNGKIIINRWTVAPRNVAEKGQLLIVCKGAGVGKMAILQEERVHIARQVMSVNAIRIKPIYIQLFLQFNISNIRKNMQGVIPGISRDDILNLLIPIPPISEQVRIIDRLDELLPVLKVL